MVLPIMFSMAGMTLANVAGIGVARQSGHRGHKLAARRATSGPMRLALANALHNNRRATMPNTLSGRAYEFGLKVSVAIACIQPSGPPEWPLGQPLDTPSAGACCTDTSTTNTLTDPRMQPCI
jgi:hypothetical protein